MNLDENSTLTLFEHFSEAASEWTHFQLILCIVLSGICIGTIVGNSVVLYVFAKSKRALRSPTHLLLANLAVADLLVGVVVMPILITITVFDWKWYWGVTACQVADYVHFCLCASSILSMTAVCLERYIGVRYPMHHNRVLSKNRVFKMIVAIWILALIFTAGPLSLWPMKGKQSPFTCQLNLRPDFIFFISISLYWIPILVTLYIYWLIYKTSTTPASELVKWAKKSLESTVMTSTTSVASSKNRNKNALSRRPSKTAEEKYEEARNKQIGIVKRITIVVSVMLIFYAPLFVIFLLIGFKVPWLSQNVLLAAGWIRYTSSFTNSFLYVFAVPFYKKRLLHIMCNVKSSSNKNKSNLGTSTALNVGSRRSSSISGGEAATSETTIKSLPTTNENSRYCKSCGKTLHRNSKCDICDEDMPGALLPPPEEWGTPKHFNCPDCMAIRFFDGMKPCFCKICNHKFLPSKAKSDGKSISYSNSNFLAAGGGVAITITQDNGADSINNGRTEFSLTEAVESAKNAQLRQLESEGPTVVIQRLRKSLMIPLQERRSRIITSAVNPSTEADVDWATIQELDEIMAKLESEVIGPLMAQSQLFENNTPKL